MIDAPAFYLPDGDGFASTEHTRGPWSPDFQHGGPPSALLGRAAQRFEAPSPGRWLVARICIELLRPVPITRLSVRAAQRRASRSIQELDLALLAGERVLCQGRALRVRQSEEAAFPVVSAPALDRPPEDCPPLELDLFNTIEGYNAAMELRCARGTWGPGPIQAWMRMRVPLVDGEPTSGLCRALTIADAGSGVAPPLDWRHYTFVNAELTVHLHREPEGEWIGMDARSQTSAHGVGMASTGLSDRAGAFGRCSQVLMLAKR